MKSQVFVLIVSLFVAPAFGSINVTFNSNGNPDYMYNQAGNQLVGGNLLIQLIVDVSGNTLQAQMLSNQQLGVSGDTWVDHASSSDDVVVGSGFWAWNGASGNTMLDAVTVPVSDSYDGRRFYFRWFNSDAQGTATEAGLIFNSANTWTVNSGTPPTVEVGYDFAVSDANVTGSEYTGAGPDGWATVAPVPEPTTMALMGLGLAAVAARRRMQKKA